ncbi:1470_t:CDS:2 [Entrophospora sp. SA101]|nr:1470_t:CDS:2 [Entrophospora sp. SA101]
MGKKTDHNNKNKRKNKASQATQSPNINDIDIATANRNNKLVADDTTILLLSVEENGISIGILDAIIYESSTSSSKNKTFKNSKDKKNKKIAEISEIKNDGSSDVKNNIDKPSKSLILNKNSNTTVKSSYSNKGKRTLKKPTESTLNHTANSEKAHLYLLMMADQQLQSTNNH